jgi:hypothetical protein
MVNRLSASPFWSNGLSPKVDLPPTASVDDVIAGVFERTSLDRGRVTSYVIVETRRVSIVGAFQEFHAVLLDTNLGRQIALLQYQGPSVGWWLQRS